MANVRKYTIHPTTLDRLSTCRLQWYWSRNYQSRRGATALELGSAVHYALEQYYKTGENPVQAFREYAKRSPSKLETTAVDLGITMMKNYVAAYQGEKLTTMATELEISRRVPIPSNEYSPKPNSGHIFLAARVDAIVKDRVTGRLFAMEHKTFETFYSLQLETSHQFVAETWLADGWAKKYLGDRVVGLIYNGLRKKATPGPTTKLFERHALYVNETQIDTLLHRVYWEVLEASDPKFKIFPQPGVMKCNLCEFRGPCIEYMRGGDSSFMLENLYDSREGDHEDLWR